MKRNHLKLLVGSVIVNSLLLVSCSDSTENTDTQSSENSENTETAKVEANESIDWEGMDTTVSPKVDFYEFSCGNWLDNNPIPEEESKWSNFNVLQDNNNDILKNLLEDAKENTGKEGEAKQLIGDLYASFADTAKRNELGTSGLDPVMEKIDAIESKEDLLDVLVHLHDHGISAGFGMYVEQDAKLNDRYALYASQSGLGLPSRDYYFKNDERSEMIRSEYKKHIADMFSIYGSDVNVDVVYGMEEKLAEKSWTPVQMRDIEAQYNKKTMADLDSEASGFNWANYLSKREMAVDTVIVGQPEFMSLIGEMVNNEPLENWKAYLKWSALNDLASGMTTALDEQNFYFYSTVMRGTEKMKPLWKRGIMMVTSSPVGEGLGEVFVQENFSEDAKKKVNEMVDNITIVFEERIQKLDWMSEPTKEKALTKLSTFVRKLGFPDVWKSYEGLAIDKNNYTQNKLNLAVFSVNENKEKLGTDINKDEWHMAPQIVNAYYNPLLNEIVFPAGIMQKPFFSESFEDAVNYARMGAVIGHELTHGFDDMGSQFDAQGKMVNWWTAEDKEKFNAKTQKLIDQYNSFEVLEGVFVNGELTLGENIADLGGLTIAYHAYQKSKDPLKNEVINGYDANQRFFIAFGQVWQNNIRENALVQRVNTDPHSPGKYRVNGTVSNMPEFFEAFNVAEEDPMRQPEDQIARIW